MREKKIGCWHGAREEQALKMLLCSHILGKYIFYTFVVSVITSNHHPLKINTYTYWDCPPKIKGSISCFSKCPKATRLPSTKASSRKKEEIIICVCREQGMVWHCYSATKSAEGGVWCKTLTHRQSTLTVWARSFPPQIIFVTKANQTLIIALSDQKTLKCLHGGELQTLYSAV